MVEYIYENPQTLPQDSAHWKALSHVSSNAHGSSDRLIQNLDELKEALSREISTTLSATSTSEGKRLAFWSCLLGYCESLSTNRSEGKRYSIYPIPWDALERLVETEFVNVLCNRKDIPANKNACGDEARTRESTDTHREAAKALSNWVWGNVISKSNAKDEQHANSVYIVLRGKIDRKSLDCFGAALSTVIGLRTLGWESFLTLSEDHAYESHYDQQQQTQGDGDDESIRATLTTCEIAIPGNTKAQQAKRGQEASKTFQDSKSNLTIKTSWLYMGMAPILCRAAPMILAAAISNMNCMIESKGQAYEKNSEELMILKRELLWILKDGGHLDKFPFALCELGWSEEHFTSRRGVTLLTNAAVASEPITTMESLYHEAIVSSKTHYLDKQVYPYAYLGFFHKDGGQSEEYRFALSLQAFAEAARVASQYKYEWGDTLQLTKVMTKISEFIVFEILSCSTSSINNTSVKPTQRQWKDESNAVATGRGLLCFFDYLLAWEERTNDRFLSILQSSHKTGIAKAFGLLEPDTRIRIFQQFDIVSNAKSLRMQGPVSKAMQKSKVTLNDMDLTIISNQEQRSSRTRKRKSR